MYQRGDGVKMRQPPQHHFAMIQVPYVVVPRLLYPTPQVMVEASGGRRGRVIRGRRGRPLFAVFTRRRRSFGFVDGIALATAVVSALENERFLRLKRSSI